MARHAFQIIVLGLPALGLWAFLHSRYEEATAYVSRMGVDKAQKVGGDWNATEVVGDLCGNVRCCFVSDGAVAGIKREVEMQEKKVESLQGEMGALAKGLVEITKSVERLRGDMSHIEDLWKSFQRNGNKRKS